jgi:hypothetical protein
MLGSWMIIVAIVILGLTAVYGHTVSGLQGMDTFADYRPGAGGVDTDALLSDFITTRQGLTAYTAEACAAVDRAREMELGGQYVQRTNNYRRDYPDNCSAPLSELVGSTYEPADGVGLTVPCAGDC